jgi:hypothetical protein
MPVSYTWPLATPTPPPAPSPALTPATASQQILFGQIIQLFPHSWLPVGIQNTPPTGLLAALFLCMANNLGWPGDIVISSISSVPSNLKAQLRLQTMSGNTMDIYAADFYGTGLPRYPGETDPHYMNRIQAGLFIPRLTRPAFFSMLQQLTSINPRLIEGWRPSNTGGLTKTTGAPVLVGGTYVYNLAANMPPSYIGVDVAAAPLRLMNPGGNVVFSPVTGTTVALSIAQGPQTVTPAAMTNIRIASVLWVNQGKSDQEIVRVTAITGTTFTALFVNAHAAGAVVTSLVNPGYGYQPFIDTTWPQGFGAQGNEADGLMTVTGSNPPSQYGGTFTTGSPSVYTNLSGGGLMKCSNSAIAVVSGRSVFTSIEAGDPNGAIFNPNGLMPADLANGQAQVLRAIDRLRAEGVTIWARCLPAAELATQGWTS